MKFSLQEKIVKNRLPFALLAASALVLAGCSSINTALNTSKQPSMEKLTPPSGQPFLTLEGKGIQIFRCAADTKGSYWHFEQPQAKLKDKSGEVVAELSGPMSAFEYKDGSRIISAYDVVSGLFPDKQKDFVFNISETDTVLVKEIKPDNNTRDMEKLAASIVDTLQGDHYIKAVVGIGTPIGNIKDLASSFKEAQIAMEVGKVFDTERQVISYDHLGIARLIYQLPTTLCEAFLREVFKQESIDSLDAETLFTIQRFFENNLNVSETSRGLFVHRNTLVYRLEKIRKLTGLDLRNFDDAIVFKVALMVKKYLSANPAKY